MHSKSYNVIISVFFSKIIPEAVNKYFNFRCDRTLTQRVNELTHWVEIRYVGSSIQIYRAFIIFFFLVFDQPLKIRVVHIRKKVKLRYSENTFNNIDQILWVYRIFQTQQFATTDISRPIVQCWPQKNVCILKPNQDHNPPIIENAFNRSSCSSEETSK